MAILGHQLFAAVRGGRGGPARSRLLGTLLVAAGLLVPLLGTTTSLPRTAVPAACVNGPTQVSSSGDSFVAVPGANQAKGSVYTFDSTSGAGLGSSQLVGYAPVSMAVDTTYGQLYVLNQGYPPSLAPSVSVFDYKTGLKFNNEITSGFPLGSKPLSIGISPGGNHVVVTDPATNSLIVIDPQGTPAIVGTVALSGPPQDLSFSQKMAHNVWGLYAGDLADNEIDVLQLTSTAPYYAYVSSVTGVHPASLLTSGQTLYAGDTNSDTVDPYQMTEQEVNGQYQPTLTPPPSDWSLPSAPDNLAVTPNGATLYASSGASTFLKIDATNGTAVSEPAPAGNDVGAMAVNADGTILEMAETNQSAVGRWAIDDEIAQDAYTEPTGIPSAIASVPSATLRFYAYVTQSAAINSDGTGDVSVIDLLAGQDIADLPVGVDPEALAVGPAGGSVYVADTGTGTNGTLKEITTSEINNLIGTNPVQDLSTKPVLPPGAAPDALALNPAGHELLVADYDLGTVYDVELNTTSPYTTTTVYLDGSGTTNSYKPLAIAVTPDGSYAYVTDYGANAITVLHSSGSSGAFTFQAMQHSASLGGTALSEPYGVAVSPDGRTVYVSDDTSSGGILHSYAINPTNGELSATGAVTLGGVPHMVSVAPTGSPIYVANAGSNVVSVVDRKPFQLDHTASAGSEPEGVATTPDGSQFVVADTNVCAQAGSVDVFAKGATTPTGTVLFSNLANPNSNPFGMAVSPAFSQPAQVQGIAQTELAGGGVNPAEVATRTGLNDLQAGVDTATGSYSISLPPLRATSPGLPLDFAPSYDSANAGTPSNANADIGNGWTFPYAMTLLTPPLSSGCDYVVSQENSSIAQFSDVVSPGNGCTDGNIADFGPAARVQASITTKPCPVGSSTCYEFTRRREMHFFFSETEQNGSYPLVAEQDVYGNTVTLTYGGGQTCNASELSSVTATGHGDSGSRSLAFAWGCPDANSNQDQIDSVTDPLGRTAKLTYGSSGNLRLYILSGGGDRLGDHVFEFAYDGSNNLTKWWDPVHSDAAIYPTLPAASTGTVVNYTTFTPPACASPIDGVTSVVAPEIDGEGQTGTTNYQPTTTISYTAYAFCPGTGSVVVTDPNQNVSGSTPSYSGDTTLESYVDRALLSVSAGYGPLDEPSVADGPSANHSDTGFAVTVYVRDPETLAAREVVDPDGDTTTTEWNGLGDPVSVTDPNGGVSTYLYDPDNEITEATDQLGRTTSYTYSEPYLTAITDPAGHTTGYLQAQDGQTCEELSPNAAAAGKSLPGTCGAVGTNPGLTTTTFDTYGDVANITDPDGDVTSSAYDLDGERCGSLSANGYVADGGPLTSCPSTGGGTYLTVDASYDVFGNLQQQVTPAQQGETNGNVWNTFFDLDGRKLAAMTPDDTSCNGDTTSNCTHATYYSYDADGDLASVTDGYGDAGGASTTTYTYDAAGNRLSMVSPDGNVQNGDPNAFRTVYTYDDLDRLIATQDPQGSPSCNPQATAHCAFVAYKAYDGAGRMISSVTPPTTAHVDGTTTIDIYDPSGNLTDAQVWDESAPTEISDTQHTYDAANQLETTVPPDGSAFTTTYTYDADGRPLTVVAPAGEGNTSGQGAGPGTTWYFYDADGNKVAVTNGEGNGTNCNAAIDNPQHPPVCASTTYYAYDLADRLTSVTGAAGQASNTATAYTYDADGNPHVVTNPGGVTTTDYYDSADELTSVTYSDGTPSVAYGYRVDGTRASVSASGAGAYSFAYSYDNAQRLASVTNGSATVAGYGYDPSGNVTSLTYPSGVAVDYGYAVDDELRTASWGSGNQLSFSYNNDGTLSTTAAQAGSSNPTVTTTDSYDGGQRLDDLSTTSTAQSSRLLDTNYNDSSNQNVKLDPNGNPLGEEVTANGTAQPTVYYAVDDVNRANYDSTTASSSRPVPASSQTYTYDKANFVTQGPAVAVQQYYGDGEIEQATSLPGGTPVSFSYDPEQDRIGESSATATTSYAFDAAGGMCWSAPTATIPAGGSTPSCSSPPTDATTYTYDGDGLRRTETTPSATQTFTWDTESSVPRLLEDGQSDYVYGPGGTPVAQVALSSGSVDFLVPDREGSVRDVVSGTTGLSLAYTDYDVYGNPTATGGLGLFTAFGFQGGYNDASGLVYFQQRYYDPGSGQFLSLDALNAMTNSGYTFVNDNPLVGTDPSGELYSCGNACGGGQQGCANAESCRSTGPTDRCANSPDYCLGPLPAGVAGGRSPAATTPYPAIECFQFGSSCKPTMTAERLSGWDWLLVGASILPFGDVFDAVAGLIGAGAEGADLAGSAALFSRAGAITNAEALAAEDGADAGDTVAVIGRQADTAVAKDWAGHEVLDLPANEWSIAKNDQWVQGVIDRKMSVYVGSNPTWENVWDAANGRTTVFGRELQQFQNAGYTWDGWYLVPPGS